MFLLKKKYSSFPQRILIVRTDRLGDVILSTPVITNLRLFFPKSYIAFMCRPYTREVVEGNPYLDEVIVYDKYGKHKSIWGSIKFTLQLRKKKFDWAVILHPTNRVHMITFFAGIPFRIGWDKKMGWFLTCKLVHTKDRGQKHELEYTLDILRNLGIPIREKKLYLPYNEQTDKFVGTILKEKGIKERDKFIVIHPSASCPSKRWPINYFIELIRLIRKEFPYKIVIISSDSEKEIASPIIKAHLEVIDLRGKLTIAEISALLKRAELFISNDSGPVHIAAVWDTPLIVIFGRKDPGLSPQRWRPLNKQAVYLHKDVGCDKCKAHHCERSFLCLYAIKPQEVWEKVRELIKN